MEVQPSYHMSTSLRNTNPLLIAVFIALVAITVAVWHATRGAEHEEVLPPAPSTKASDVRGIEPTDHILGNPNAPLVFIVYSDFRCPFCKDYHNSMTRIVETYGREGEVALVLRHMPIVKLHPESPTYALASECVAQEGGNKAFWEFAELMFDTVTEEHSPNSQELVALAEEVGVSGTDFAACMRTSNLMSRVEKDFDEVINVGARATPYTVVVTPYQHIARDGVRSYAVIAASVETILRNLKVQRTHEENAASFNFDEEVVEEASRSTTSNSFDAS
jgi:protein-disulfide isomerase